MTTQLSMMLYHLYLMKTVANIMTKLFTWIRFIVISTRWFWSWPPETTSTISWYWLWILNDFYFYYTFSLKSTFILTSKIIYCFVYIKPFLCTCLYCMMYVWSSIPKLLPWLFLSFDIHIVLLELLEGLWTAILDNISDHLSLFWYNSLHLLNVILSMEISVKFISFCYK